MQTSERGKAALVHKEGLVLKAYLCPANVWTIGVGHTSAAGSPRVTPGMTISRAEAMEILANDLRRFEARTARHMDYERGPDEQAAFDGGVLWDFNCGRIHDASWVRHFNAGDYGAARASFMQWVRGGGKILLGLVKRREIEAAMIFDGLYPDERDVAATNVSGTPHGLARWVVAATDEQKRAFREAIASFGYDPDGGLHGLRPEEVLATAVRAFQADHDLTVDGLIGAATLATLQREIDARRGARGAGAGAAAGGATAAGAPAAVETIPPEAVPPDMPDLLLDAAVLQAIGVVVLALAALRIAWLAYRYRDVVASRIQRIAPRLAARLRSF